MISWNWLLLSVWQQILTLVWVTQERLVLLSPLPVPTALPPQPAARPDSCSRARCPTHLGWGQGTDAGPRNEGSENPGLRLSLLCTIRSTALSLWGKPGETLHGNGDLKAGYTLKARTEILTGGGKDAGPQVSLMGEETGRPDDLRPSGICQVSSVTLTQPPAEPRTDTGTQPCLHPRASGPAAGRPDTTSWMFCLADRVF